MLWGLKITDLAGCVQADIPVTGGRAGM